VQFPLDMRAPDGADVRPQGPLGTLTDDLMAWPV
jgi:hypothetical protein